MASSAVQRNEAAPVTNLSEDILSLIFEAGRNELPLGFDKRPKSPLKFEILVSHISSRWRSIALCDPFLWTSVDIKMSQSNDLQNLYFQRSQSLALDIFLLCDLEHINYFDSSTIQPHRCRSLTIKLTSYSSAAQLFPLLNHIHMPLLTSLSIDGEEADEEEISYLPELESPVLIFSAGAPLLTHLNLCGISVESCIPPLGSITHLHLHIPEWGAYVSSFTTFANVLSGCANTLTHLLLEGIVTRFDEDNQEEVEYRIVLPALHSLQIEFQPLVDYDENDQDDFFYGPNISQHLTAPVLQNLWLKCMSGSDPYSAMAILDNYRAGPGTRGLRSLTLCDTEVYDEDMEDLFRRCPDIEDLNLDSLSSKAILKGILEGVRAGSSRVLWPRLCNITLNNPHSYELQLLRDVVERRMEIGWPIASHVSSRVLESAEQNVSMDTEED